MDRKKFMELRGKKSEKKIRRFQNKIASSSVADTQFS